MFTTFKKILRFMFSRVFAGFLLIAVQIALLILGVNYLSRSFFYVYMLFNAFSLFAMFFVISNHDNPGYKIIWIVAILAFPVVGWLIYLMIGNKRMPAKLRRRMEATLEDTRFHMPDNSLCHDRLEPQSPQLATQSSYIYGVSGYPLWRQGGGAEYFPVGERMFEAMLEELRQAQDYIFLEYFIIRPGKMWDAVFAILKEKAAQGVEVWLMYDGLGCMGTLPPGYRKVIRAAGVRVCVFNPFRPRVSVILNYRDHRKMLIVDGRAAFCGGINLADEYINEYERFGHWKDTGVLLRGEAVWPFVFMFLQQWRFNADEELEIDFGRYHAAPTDCAPDSAALVQPFGDSPLDNDNVTESTYLNIITRASKYVYITTPYLVIDHETETALCVAAQSGVDVRIITPHRYDKWYVHILTRSHYARLTRCGVKVYEYTPGFMHGKMIVADDEICMVGTCNMDYRSFYLHFECSVLFYHSQIAATVKEDILAAQQQSQLITHEQTRHAPVSTRMLRALLKLFAPLM